MRAAQLNQRPGQVAKFGLAFRGKESMNLEHSSRGRRLIQRQTGGADSSVGLKNTDTQILKCKEVGESLAAAGKPTLKSVDAT